MEFYKRFLIGLGLMIGGLIIAFGFWFFNVGMFSNIIFYNQPSQPREVRQSREFNNPFKLDIKVKGAEDVKINYLPENKDVERPKMVGKIPFTPQAPFGEWDNPIYQDGCEEAAVLMSIKWARGEELSLDAADKEITAMADWQIEKYGEFRDTSVEDTTSRIIKEYFGYAGAEVRKNISLDDIILELNKGRLIIVPTNGQALDNPYYTPPGPARHNLVIYRYDKETHEFITNDPGTKRGEGYRYKAEVLFNAIQDYPSGYHIPIEKIEKNVIVISRFD